MPDPISQTDIGPQFVLSLFVEPDDPAEVDLHIAQIAQPDIRRHASQALLYGLAIMTLDNDGTIAQRIDDMLAQGPINEVDAVNRIELLIQKAENAIPA